jgi:hypothetical protein
MSIDFDKLFNLNNPKGIIVTHADTSMSKPEVTKARSLYFYRAQMLYKLITDSKGRFVSRDRNEIRCACEGLIPSFTSWYNIYESGRFVALSKDDKWIFIRCFIRFFKVYKRKLWNRMYFLGNVPFQFKLELTVDPKKFEYLHEEYDFINVGWAKLRAWLYKRYGHFEFLKILEVHRSGRPHLHILLVFNSKPKKIPIKDISEIWQKYGGGKNCWIRKLENSFDALLYVLKYVNKSLKTTDKVYSAVLFASNKRLFSMSRKLQSITRRDKESEKGFEYQGVVNENHLKEFCQEKDIKFSDYVVIAEVSLELMSEFPLVFCIRDVG